MKLPITYLFVPGNRPERFDKALASGTDAVILDLEDAVASRDKDAARASVQHWIAANRGAAERILVRINDSATPWFAADLDMLRDSDIPSAMLPKAETQAQIQAVAAALRAGGGVLAIIETALGLKNVDAVAAARGVTRIAFGTLDFGVDLNLSGDDRGLIYPSAQIALASRCAGIGSPVAGVTPTIGDEGRLLADLAFARAFGYGAKLCIHPKQVAAIRQALIPTAAEIHWARRVIAAVEASEGAAQVDGKMVDRPVLLKAQSILALVAA